MSNNNTSSGLCNFVIFILIVFGVMFGLFTPLSFGPQLLNVKVRTNENNNNNNNIALGDKIMFFTCHEIELLSDCIPINVSPTRQEADLFVRMLQRKRSGVYHVDPIPQSKWTIKHKNLVTKFISQQINQNKSF